MVFFCMGLMIVGVILIVGFLMFLFIMLLLFDLCSSLIVWDLMLSYMML